MNVSIRDIAKQLNISISTVSRALNGRYGVNPKTRQAVLEAAKRVGYIPNLGAKELVNKRSHLIGLILPESDVEARPPLFEIFPSIDKVLKQDEKDTIVEFVSCDNYQDGTLNRLFGKRNLEGCIILPGFGSNHSIFQEVKSVQKPVLFLQEEILENLCSSVSSDDISGAYIATRHLIECGHRHIAFLNGPLAATICKKRQEGYEKALMECGMQANPEYICATDFSGRQAAEQAVALKHRHPSITAMFCASDALAMAAMSALQQEHIRVPEDVSIIGYDNAFFSPHTFPPLTTVQHGSGMGTRAAELLVELIHGGQERHEVLQPKLIERASVSTPVSR